MTTQTHDRHAMNRAWVEHMERLNEKHGIQPAIEPLPDHLHPDPTDRVNDHDH